MRVSKAAGRGQPFAGAERVCALYHLHRATRVADQLYDAAYRPLGLRATQVFLLVLIRNLQPVPLKRLARAALLDPTTLSRNLRPLQKPGWVKLMPGDDRRVRVARLTSAGARQVRLAYPAWRASQAHVAGRLGKKKLRQLVGGLESLVDTLRGGPRGMQARPPKSRRNAS